MSKKGISIQYKSHNAFASHNMKQYNEEEEERQQLVRKDNQDNDNIN